MLRKSMCAVLFVFLGALLVGACAPHVPVISTKPEIMRWDAADANPDRIWVIRRVVTPQSSKFNNRKPKGSHYGLFACYRSETPGQPKCYLAKIIADRSDLTWPSNPERFKFLD